jgi:hypothetical protein
MRRLLLSASAVAVLAGALAGCGGTDRAGFPTGSAARSTPAGSPGVAAVGPDSASATPSPAGSSGVAGCQTFPADNIWHADISRLPVHPSSGAWVTSVGVTRNAHPDFGSGLVDGAPFGIPVTTASSGQAKAAVSFDYADESDPGPYPIPPNALIEGGPNADGDRHVLVRDAAACKVYELFDARRNANGSWHAAAGAVFDLRSNRLRPAGWTSADAAGLSIYAGLARADEVAAGRIDHALRITAPRTRNTYVWPARHAAGSADPALAPMGARFRLKANVDVSRFPPQARVIAEALKRYGAILADNGSAWYITGTQDERWKNSELNALKGLSGNDFEAVDAAPLMADANSGATRR